MTTTASPKTETSKRYVIDTEAVNAAAAKLTASISGQYTPINAVSDFLLDARSAGSKDPLFVAQVDKLHTELAPSAQRTIVKSPQATEILDQVLLAATN